MLNLNNEPPGGIFLNLYGLLRNTKFISPDLTFTRWGAPMFPHRHGALQSGLHVNVLGGLHSAGYDAGTEDGTWKVA